MLLPWERRRRGKLHFLILVTLWPFVYCNQYYFNSPSFVKFDIDIHGPLWKNTNACADPWAFVHCGHKGKFPLAHKKNVICRLPWHWLTAFMLPMVALLCNNATGFPLAWGAGQTLHKNKIIQNSKVITFWCFVEKWTFVYVLLEGLRLVAPFLRQCKHKLQKWSVICHSHLCQSHTWNK